MSSRAYKVNARWDEVSKTWWTDGEDIPGLCCQADSFEELIEAVLALAPELLRDNGIEPPGQAVEIYRDRQAACYGVYRRLTALLREAGCRFERQGKGSHEIWFSDHAADLHRPVQHTQSGAGERNLEAGWSAQRILKHNLTSPIGPGGRGRQCVGDPRDASRGSSSMKKGD